MIATTPELASFMDSARFAVRVDLYTLTLASGQVLRWASGNAPLLLTDGRLFQLGPLLKRGKLELRTGLEVGELTVEITPRASDTIAGQPLIRYAQRGGLRGVQLQLEWAYLDAAGQLQGVMPRFSGRGSPDDYEGGTITLRVRDDLEALLVQMPKDVYQPTCLNTVYDARCGKSRAAMRITGTVSSITPGNRSGFGSALGQATGYFALGRLRFTSGANAGVSRTVRSFSGGAFSVALPLPEVIAVGDAFEVWPGCDGSKATCSTRFANLPRFRAAPHTPAPEVAL